jgi:VanZ family protein
MYRTLWVRAWTLACVVALVVLAWTPGQYMVRTGFLTGHQEHFLAYFLSALTISGAQARVLFPGRIGLLLVLYAALLECGQICVPGRHPAIGDFAASSIGALIGAAMILVALKFFSDSRQHS